MKKLVLIFLMAALLTTMGFSQIKFGITGGVNMNTFTGDVEDLDPSFKAGIAGGAFAEVGLLGISIAPEVLFVMKGTKLKILDKEINSQFNYIEIPILARFYIPSIVIKPFITAGPYYSMLLSAKQDQVQYPSLDIKKDVDVKDDMESQDFGIKIGAGLKLTKFTVM